MANLNLTEMREKLRNNLSQYAPKGDKDDPLMAAFDRAWADTVTDLVDGNSAPEAKPKRKYQSRKAKPDTGTPKTE